MSTGFTTTEWNKINQRFDTDWQRHGVPEGGREASLIFSSFNIRKLGGIRVGKKKLNRRPYIDFMARYCARCDLIAIQEVQDNLDALFELMTRMEDHIAEPGAFGLVVSDVTGKEPGGGGMAERLAFLFRWTRVRRSPMTSDIGYDRTAVVRNVLQNAEALTKQLKAHDAAVTAAKKAKKKPPTFVPKNFVTFIRSPHCTSFEILGANGADPLGFIAVNAHLTFDNGNLLQRKFEFEELVQWLAHRLKADDRMIHPNFILLGDLNLNFEHIEESRDEIDDYLKGLNKKVFRRATANRIYFPFIDPHPGTGQVFRTTPSGKQTYDHIAFFRAKTERRLPEVGMADPAGTSGPDGFDYGMFNFYDLIAEALFGSGYAALSKARKSHVKERTEHLLSDHMPIWTRIPRPGFS